MVFTCEDCVSQTSCITVVLDSGRMRTEETMRVKQELETPAQVLRGEINVLPNFCTISKC